METKQINRYKDEDGNFASIEVLFLASEHAWWEELIELDFDLQRHVPDVPKNKALFNKRQWKQMCANPFVGLFIFIRNKQKL